MFASYREVVASLRQADVSPGDPLTMPLGEARLRQHRYFAWLGQDMPVVAVRQDVVTEGPAGPLRLRILGPKADRATPVVLFIRGAGWWAGDLDSHERPTRVFSIASGLAVCSVDYHRTPEHRYPVQKNEVLAAVNWIRTEGRDHGLDPAHLVFWGESAGATLALSAAQALCTAGDAGLSGLILFYGNFGAPEPSARPYSHWVYEQYLGDPELRNDPGAVPLLADMHRLPPTWLGVGEQDPLLPTTLTLAEKLRAAGVPTEVACYPDLPHAFVGLSRLLDGADAALHAAASAAKRMVS